MRVLPLERSRRGRLIPAALILAIAGIATVGVIDERWLGTGVRLELSREQQVLATVLASELRTSLKEIADHGPVGPPEVRDGVWQFGDLTFEPRGIGDAFPADAEVRLLLWRAGGHELWTFDGETVVVPSVARAASERAERAWLTPVEAAALGLPSSPAVAGLATFYAGALGDWTVAVVSSIEPQRLRETRRYARTIVMVSLASLVVLGFCLVVLRGQQHERALMRELMREGQRFDRESELAREGRGVAMMTFAAGVAHELSTPLGVITMRAEQIENHSDDDLIRRHARSISDQVDRLRSHTHRFLALTRGIAPLCERFIASEVVQSAVVRVQHRFERADVKLMITACERPPQLCGDARLLEQSLVDLLLRACDVSRPDGEVELSISRAAGDLIISISDRGAEPVPRVPTAVDGRGRLDLLIASEVLRIHRGELTFVARPGGGTCACLRVPIDAAETGEPSPVEVT